MIWWGPAGIGATYTIERYAKQHSGPFRAAFPGAEGTGTSAVAEGRFGGFFGWPNFTAIPRGGFMGMPASDTPGEFRVGGHLPARGRQARRELGVHRHPALPEDAGARRAGARSNGVRGRLGQQTLSGGAGPSRPRRVAGLRVDHAGLRSDWLSVCRFADVQFVRTPEAPASQSRACGCQRRIRS